MRLRTAQPTITFTDRVLGQVTGTVDDVVLRRNDGTPSYNLAVVVDDAVQGIELVVRGDDLASSTPRQLHLYDLLDLPRPDHAHVPLVVGPDGMRLAKRHGSVTLADLTGDGWSVGEVVGALAASAGLDPSARVASDLLERFEPESIRSESTTWPTQQRPAGADGGKDTMV